MFMVTDTTAIVGLVLFSGFVFGELASLIRLPRVTGYIVAGVFLNPSVFGIIPKNFAEHTDFVTNISLSFITFSIGGTLAFAKLKKLGKSISLITLWEAEMTFIVVALAVAFILPFFVHEKSATLLTTFIPLGLIVGAIASPTDPTGTLAVVHEYKAKGDVTSTILSVSAFDDALGLINFSLAIVFAKMLVIHQAFSVHASIIVPLKEVGGALVVGTIFGFIFNKFSKMIVKEKAGVLIVMLFGVLLLCYGGAHRLKFDELLATMTMGIVVTNFNKNSAKIFEILENYTEEFVFVLFFTLCGMYLNFNVLWTGFIFVLVYTVFRTFGKFVGTSIGCWLSGAGKNVRKYTAFGLIPSGGIIVGLALVLKQTPEFDNFSDIVISVIIGATVIHEIVGPILVKFALKRSNETERGQA